MCQSCASLKPGDLLFVDEPYNILLSPKDATGEARSGIAPDRLRISFGLQHARKVHKGDAMLDAKWQEACEYDPELADRSLFRLDKVEWTEGGTQVALSLGLTSVKEFIGTNRLPVPLRQLRRQDGEREQKNQDAHMSNAIGCEVLLLTSDEKAVLLWCAPEASKLVPNRFASRSEGRFSGPFSLPEPERAGINGAEEAKSGVQQSIAAELFDSALRSVEERIGVPREKLSQPRLMGCMADSRHCKPDLLFLVHTSLDVAAIRAQHKELVGNGGDPDNLDFWPLASLSDCPILATCTFRAAADCVAALALGAPVWQEHRPSSTANQPTKAKPQAKSQAKETRPKATPGKNGQPSSWLVVGGVEKGLVVREACDLKSPELPRLAHGARVEEVSRTGDRLHFKKLAGDGPDSGWVSVAINGKELLVRE